MAEASAHVDWLAKRNPGLRPENLGHQLVAEDPFWVRLISDERLLDIAEHYLGPNIALFASLRSSRNTGNRRSGIRTDRIGRWSRWRL